MQHYDLIIGAGSAATHAAEGLNKAGWKNELELSAKHILIACGEEPVPLRGQ